MDELPAVTRGVAEARKRGIERVPFHDPRRCDGVGDPMCANCGRRAPLEPGMSYLFITPDLHHDGGELVCGDRVHQQTVEDTRT